MVLYNLLQIGSLPQILVQLDPIHLNHLLGEVVDQALDEMDDAIVGRIGLPETVHTRL